jgi:lysosomal-trafficking regulator
LPFTTLFLHYQDNNFDIPDRTFHSLQTTWRLASKDSPTDVKELIPEFFCLPEMLENCQGFNFGHRQSGEPVHHIALPAWCQNSSRLFTFIHRQALESDIVRSSLNSWIDLIFGYKQTGQAAVDAINVFHPATHHNFDIANINDVVERMAFETMVRTYGQMPKKLFRAPHPNSKWLQTPTQQENAEIALAPPAPPVMSTVIGLKWGWYTGSPQLAAPRMIDFLEQFEINFNCLVALEATNVVYGVPDKCNIMRGYEVDTLNIVAWGELDDIVRIKSLSDDCEYAPRHLIHIPKIDPVRIAGFKTV